jgi:hypothetical protein
MADESQGPDQKFVGAYLRNGGLVGNDLRVNCNQNRYFDTIGCDAIIDAFTS